MKQRYRKLSPMQTALFEAIDHCGDATKLARMLKVHKNAVYNWIRRNSIPPHRAVQIEEVTKGKVTAAKLLPALFKIRTTKR